MEIESTDVVPNIRRVQRRIATAAEKAGRSPADITVIGATKTVGPSHIQEAFAAGLRHFGENRVQEAKSKITHIATFQLQPPPVWHMVGHLQTNKARTAVELFGVVHCVDSIRLAEAISEHAQRAMPILIQVNVSGEASKFGFAPGEVGAALAHIARFPRLEIEGLMTIAPYTSEPEDIRPFFRELRLLNDSLGLEHLSMGMTDDFEVAIEEGATMVRIGRAIFGEREV